MLLRTMTLPKFQALAPTVKISARLLVVLGVALCA
ncbi:MAG: hypothetical protein JWM35_496, partial [Verrucomicrobia bacterium]|nr:hypothetical protein [Verrucomicrobiota bacterium]